MPHQPFANERDNPMTFGAPLLLLLLLLPLASLAWVASQRRHASTSFGAKILRGEATRSSIRVSKSEPRPIRSIRRLYLHLGIAGVIVAIAKPQWGKLEEPVFSHSREIIIALDLSRSMLATDVKPSRLDRSKLLIQSLLEQLVGERVGLIIFSGTAFLQIPLSSDYEILREFLPSLDPNYLPEGGSNYRAMLETAFHSFSTDSNADRFLIILSDGEATDDNWEQVVERMVAGHIRTIGLGVGTTEGSMVPDSSGGFVKDERGAVVLSRLENGTLQKIAEKTHGAYVDASSWVDLASILKATVVAGVKGEFAEQHHVRLAERFQWVLVPSLLLLLWSFYREFPVRPRPRELKLAPRRT